MFAGVPLVIVWLLGQALLASSQTSNATCAPDHKWAFNSEQQSPCVVASTLLAVCTGTYEVYSLPDQWQYDGPDMQDANPCWCNTVVYSLLAECGLCQNRTISMWSVWEVNCASVSINSFPLPLPTGLHVPGWAYLNVQASDMFNESLAEANANVTESTAIPQPSKTASLTTTSSAAAQSTTAAASSSATVINEKRSNAIGGGIVGGVFALVLLCCLGFWIRRRQRTARTRGEILDSPDMSQHQTDTLPIQSAVPVPSITVSSLNSQPGSASIRSGLTV
ncbi:hypothetical protein B0H11DRAFT_2215883 [Mycena galericulata]|nr:hypothetical protein B0H11DRAFT_2215883 [Mycena galericulata]